MSSSGTTSRYDAYLLLDLLEESCRKSTFYPERRVAFVQKTRNDIDRRVVAASKTREDLTVNEMKSLCTKVVKMMVQQMMDAKGEATKIFSTNELKQALRMMKNSGGQQPQSLVKNSKSADGFARAGSLDDTNTDPMVRQGSVPSPSREVKAEDSQSAAAATAASRDDEVFNGFTRTRMREELCGTARTNAKRPRLNLSADGESEAEQLLVRVARGFCEAQLTRLIALSRHRREAVVAAAADKVEDEKAPAEKNELAARFGGCDALPPIAEETPNVITAPPPQQPLAPAAAQPLSKITSDDIMMYLAHSRLHTENADYLVAETKLRRLGGDFDIMRELEKEKKKARRRAEQMRPPENNNV